MAEISVIIPTKNRWGTLRRTLPSALAQEGVDHEVVVVDDGSTDETPARLAELDDPRVRVVRHETSRGQAAAWNSGLAVAGGEWVALLDDDDFWAPTKLRDQLRAARAADAVFAWSGAAIVDEDLHVLQTFPAPDADGLIDLVLSNATIPAGASNVIARKDVVEAVGGFDEKLSKFVDWDMWIRLVVSGPGAACPTLHVAYVEHPTNRLVTDQKGSLVGFDRVEAKYSDIFEQYGVAPDRAGLWSWVGWGYSRAGSRFRATWFFLRAALARPPYGSKHNVKYAVRALLGGVPQFYGPPRPDPELLPQMEWLDRYRAAG